METVTILFYTSLAILSYTYVGYPILLFILKSIKGRKALPQLSEEDFPEITHVIAAYNEQDIIADKILNCINLDYPQNRMKTIIVTDGSSDNTNQIISNYPQIKTYFKPERNGKLAAVDRVMKEVTTPITIFSDANAMLNSASLKNMVRHFQSNSVGAVAGEKVVLNEKEDDAASAGEGLYWKYESKLKQWDYQAGSVVGAAGELFAIRTSLYEKPAANILIEDFVMTMKIAARGFQVAYEKDAQAMEVSSASIDEELKRKVRISAGGLQAVWLLRGLLNPFKHGMLTFQYLSHRALRWTLAPLAMMTLIISNILLTLGDTLFFDVTMFGQILFYISAAAGYYFEDKKMRVKAFFVPFYFTFMHFNVFLGLLKLISGSFDVKWEKAARKQQELSKMSIS
ncbi:MAG: glycosyltransferase family 2 protein [Cyclobacteriaceae bacterium]